MTKRKLLAAAALLAVTATASAATFTEVGEAIPSPITLAHGTTIDLIGDLINTGDSDLWTFNVLSGPAYGGVLGLRITGNTSAFAIALNGGNLIAHTTTPTLTLFTLPNMQSGTNTLEFKFDPSAPLDPGNSVHYVASITSPAPEPETYAMLLAGLGLVGGIARRRRNAAK